MMGALIMEERGDAIPGSRFLRDFCDACGEPIRVTSIARPNHCDSCRPEEAALLPNGMRLWPGSHLVGDKIHLGKPNKKK